MVLETLLERWTAIAPRLGLVAKAKVTLSYFQVVLVMPEAFDVPMPPEYHAVSAPSLPILCAPRVLAAPSVVACAKTLPIA